MTILTESEALDQNVPIAEQLPDGIKASAYFEDFLFRLFQDIENINTNAGPAYGEILVSGQPTLTAPAPSSPVEFIAGTGIAITTSATPDEVTFTNTDPFPEAPIDGMPYGRRDAGWVDLTSLFIGDAPSDGTYYGRQNGTWQNVTEEAPNDANPYGRQSLGWVNLNTLFIGDAPADGNLYGRLNNAWVLATLQRAYDAATAVPQIIVNGTPDPLTVRATVSGGIFQVQRSDAINMLGVDDTGVDAGRGGRRAWRVTQADGTGRFGTELYPDDYTITTATGFNSAFYTEASRTITTNIPGGGGLGNDTAPGAMNLTHTARFESPGFLFASQLLINAAVQVECAANIGPLYLFLDQYRTYADGGSRTCSQHNAMRAQPRWGANINGGSITQTSAQLYFAFATVDGTVGSASIGTLEYFTAINPSLVAGGTIGTFRVLQIPNISGPSTIQGINSAMNNGTFINHTGLADSLFTQSDFRFNDNFGINLGNSQDVRLIWNPAGRFEWVPAVGARLQLEFGVDSGSDFYLFEAANFPAPVATPTGIRFGFDRFAFGQTGSIGNQVGVFTAGTRQADVAGGWSDYLLTQGGNLDLQTFAMSDVAAWTINPISLNNSAYSIASLDTLVIGGMTTSNPGGTVTERSALRVTGRTKLRGEVQYPPINPAALVAGDNNNWAGLLTASPNNNGRYWARVSGNATTSVITGIDATAVQDGSTFEITNISANLIVLSHQDTASSAANRLEIPAGGQSIVVNEGQTATVRYDTAISRWRVINVTRRLQSGGGLIHSEWQFDSSTTMADPGSGGFRLNNGTLASVTACAINDTSKTGLDASVPLSQLASGDRVYFSNSEDASEFLVLLITSTVDNTTWWQINGTVVDSGNAFTAGKEFSIAFQYN